MDERVAQLTAGFLERRAPADDREIEEAERRLGYRFPDEYRDLMRSWNGGEGFVGDGAYLMLWEVGSLPQENEDYEVDANAPGFVLFGSSGGGLFYAFERSSGRIFDLPSMPVDGSSAQRVADTIAELFEHLAAQKRDE